jgi:hypothetical protein
VVCCLIHYCKTLCIAHTGVGCTLADDYKIIEGRTD